MLRKIAAYILLIVQQVCAAGVWLCAEGVKLVAGRDVVAAAEAERSSWPADAPFGSGLPFEPDDHEEWGEWNLDGMTLMHALQMAHEGTSPYEVVMHLLEEHNG